MRTFGIPSAGAALAASVAAAAGLAACGGPPARFDVIVRGGLVFDGSGADAVRADVGITGDRIEAVGDLSRAAAALDLDATGLAVAPGFINMLSWSTESLIIDGRSESEIRQGVTTEIFGEGESMGPLTDEMKRRWKARQGDLRFDYAWTSLAEYLAFLETKGVAPNVASFIGAGTIREHVVGLDNRPPSPAELDRMRALVRAEMEAGALGIGSSLIYAPDSFASTEELVELCRVAAAYRGKYISHLRSEGNRLIEAVEELLHISREAGIPAEIYHLKAAGEANWPKMDRVLAMVDEARAAGLRITADVYLYTAGSTGLDAAIPPWAREGGHEALFRRIRTPAERARIRREMALPSDEWENLYLAAGSPERVILVGFRNDRLKPLTGRTLASVAAERGRDPFDTILDLVLEDESRVGAVYFLMSEDNLRRQLRKPWVSLGSDGASTAPEGVFLKSSNHPRSYGNFARLLGHYVRDEGVIALADAIHRMTGLPAANLELDRRGFLRPGYFADVVVFDPATIRDHATFAEPKLYATGVRDVFVNGVQVLAGGAHTGRLPGRALHGPGRTR